MTSRIRGVAFVATLALLAAACGSTTPPTPSAAVATGSAKPSVLPVPINLEYAVGDNRMLFTLTDPKGQKQIAGPSRTLSIGYPGPKGETIAPAPQTFIWAIQDVNGVYVGHASFASSGQWTAEFTTAAPGSPSET